jgi:hypothetical protein
MQVSTPENPVSQDLIAVCTNDVRKFSASTIIDILRTHRYVIAGGVLRETVLCHWMSFWPN